MLTFNKIKAEMLEIFIINTALKKEHKFIFQLKQQKSFK